MKAILVLLVFAVGAAAQSRINPVTGLIDLTGPTGPQGPQGDPGAGITTLNTLTALTQTFATGTTGTDFNIVSGTSTHTFNFPNASATNRGLLLSADWTLFNAKEAVLSFSAPLSRVSNTISIPAATSSQNGYLASADWITFNAKYGSGSNAAFGSMTVTATGAGTPVVGRTHASTVATDPFFGVQNSSNTWLGGILGNGRFNNPNQVSGAAVFDSNGTLVLASGTASDCVKVDGSSGTCGSGGGSVSAAYSVTMSGAEQTITYATHAVGGPVDVACFNASTEKALVPFTADPADTTPDVVIGAFTGTCLITSLHSSSGSGGAGTWGSITGTLSSQTDLQSALDLKATLASPTFTGTVSGITAAMVGLGSVDNTADAAKNVATAAALAANGANCSANQAAGGVSAAGASESCIDLPALYQPLDADLTALAALGATAGIVKRTGAGAFGLAAAGTDYVAPAGNVATATALAANGANCSAGQFPLGVDASGAVETCTALPTTISGTSNQITASASTGAITLSLPATIDLGGQTSFEIPNAAAPTVDAFGEIAGDNNLWAASRGAPVFYDGTAAVALIGALVSDTPTNGQVPTWNTGGTITWETPGAGSGTVTVVSSGSLTSTALVTGGGTTTLQTPAATATMDSSGNISTPGTISSGVGGSVGGYIGLTQGTATTPGTNEIGISAPTAVTAYRIDLPGTAGTGFWLSTNSSNVETVTHIASTGSGNVVRATSAALTTPDLGTPSAATLTNATGLPISTGVSGLGTGVATFLATPSSANLISAVTNETGTGALMFATSPTITTSIILPNATPTTEAHVAFDTTADTLTFGNGTTTDRSAKVNGAAPAAGFARFAGSTYALTSAAIADADVPDTITVSNYVPLAGGTMTGNLLIDNAQEIRLLEADGNGSNYIGFKAPAAITSDLTLTWAVTGDCGGSNGGALSILSSQIVCQDDDGGAGGLASTDIDTSAELAAILTDETGTAGGFLRATTSSTVGQVLRVGSGPTIGFGAVDLADTDAVTGTLPAGNLPTASTTASGIAEAAIGSEVDTGTDAARYVTPDALAGSTIFGRRAIQVVVFDFTTANATGDGKFYLWMPPEINGMNLVAISAQVISVGTTGTLNVDIARCAAVATGNACSGTVVDVLSTNLTIDSNEDDSSTAAAAAVIDTANDDVSTGQVYRIDVDAIHTTPAQGLIVNLEFQLP